MNNLNEQEKRKRKVGDNITISLPRNFYDEYFRLQLFKHYTSFSDMVRDSCRRNMERLESRIEVAKYREEKDTFGAQ